MCLGVVRAHVVVARSNQDPVALLRRVDGVLNGVETAGDPVEGADPQDAGPGRRRRGSEEGKRKEAKRERAQPRMLSTSPPSSAIHPGWQPNALLTASQSSRASERSRSTRLTARVAGSTVGRDRLVGGGGDGIGGGAGGFP